MKNTGEIIYKENWEGIWMRKYRDKENERMERKRTQNNITVRRN